MDPTSKDPGHSDCTGDADTPAMSTPPAICDLRATTAALSTNELLHHILSQVPPDYLWDLRRVSKTWRHVISKLRIDPVEKHRELLGHPATSAWEWQVDSCADMPHDPSNINFKIDPFITHSISKHLYGPNHGTLFLHALKLDRNASPTHMLEQQQEFITHPPITMLALSVGYSDVVAIMRMVEGIRVGDLAQIFEKMDVLDWDGKRNGKRERATAFFVVCHKSTEDHCRTYQVNVDFGESDDDYE